MYRSLLTSVTEQRRRFGSEPQPPCTEIQIAQLTDGVAKQLAAQLPAGYIDFLRLGNGLDWNGLVIFASERVAIASHPDRFIAGFVEMNLVFREADTSRSLIFGSDGMDVYTYDQSTGIYEIRDEVSRDVIDSLHSFDAMMVKALTRCLQ